VWQAAANNKAVADVDLAFGNVLLFSMPEKQALYSEFSQPNRISHSVRH
jgi:hypothetical protein